VLPEAARLAEQLVGVSLDGGEQPGAAIDGVDQLDVAGAFSVRPAPHMAPVEDLAVPAATFVFCDRFGFHLVGRFGQPGEAAPAGRFEQVALALGAPSGRLGDLLDLTFRHRPVAGLVGDLGQLAELTGGAKRPTRRRHRHPGLG
jgi:hypothetical protein